ncbi:hypothetical protein ACHAWF_001319 [Thalassiosira exigua]
MQSRSMRRPLASTGRGFVAAVFALLIPFVYLAASQTNYLSSLSFDAENFATPQQIAGGNAARSDCDTASTSTPSTTKSKWKLWHEMNATQQSEELEKVMARAAPYGSMLVGNDKKATFHNDCADGKKPTLFGKGGEHMVCGPRPNETAGCKFFSFGIRDDPSWDKALAEAWDCRGFAGDPSVAHPSKLHPSVTFHNVGLNVLRSNAEQRKDPKDEWILASLPRLREFLGWDYVDVVKIDCEGCEVAMARDVLLEDPTFLDRVGQISIETHGTKTWVNDTEELYYFALMFPLLEEAGFELIWTDVFGCGKYEHDGCRPEMEGKMNVSCGSRRRNKVNRVPIGWSCHDWLWARV